jgi:hypothetical protein
MDDLVLHLQLNAPPKTNFSEKKSAAVGIWNYYKIMVKEQYGNDIINV